MFSFEKSFGIHVLGQTEWWLEMVGNRFWSTFSHFTDEELKAGIEEIRSTHGDGSEISFTEQMVFITATKPK